MNREKPQKGENDVAVIPYIVYEDVADRFERTQKNLRFVAVLAIILAIALVIALVSVNRFWSEAMHNCNFSRTEQNDDSAETTG